MRERERERARASMRRRLLLLRGALRHYKRAMAHTQNETSLLVRTSGAQDGCVSLIDSASGNLIRKIEGCVFSFFLKCVYVVIQPPPIYSHSKAVRSVS